MVFSNDYTQHPLLPNFHSSSTSTSNFGLEINPFQHQNFTHEMGNFFLPLYHQDPPPNNEVITPSSYLPNHPNSLHCKQEVKALSLSKKDRHTKISTAHGVRDRRVRLSMEVAREFFDLQDMLGFDKASKTLGWLLANSNSAIQELAVEKKRSGFIGSFAFNTDHEDLIGSSTTMRKGRKKKIRVFRDIGRAQSSCRSVRGNYSVVAREKRSKARERARERTREKMCSKDKMVQFDHNNGIGYCFSNLLVDSNVEGLNHCRFVQGDDPEGTISSLLGWNINEMHICGQLETNQLHQSS